VWNIRNETKNGLGWPLARREDEKERKKRGVCNLFLSKSQNFTAPYQKTKSQPEVGWLLVTVFSGSLELPAEVQQASALAVGKAADE
jgi:hypothetical protein